LDSSLLERKRFVGAQYLRASLGELRRLDLGLILLVDRLGRIILTLSSPAHHYERIQGLDKVGSTD